MEKSIYGAAAKYIVTHLVILLLLVLIWQADTNLTERLDKDL
jgi:hypothetical protein